MIALGVSSFGHLSRTHYQNQKSLGPYLEEVEAGRLPIQRALRVSEEEHSDLFWALRGGSGNFGVVTEFNFRLHEVGPDLLSGLVVYPLEQAKEALRKYREIAAGLGDETSVWAVLRQAPPLPFLPEEVHGKPVVVFALCHAGDPEEGRQAIGGRSALWRSSWRSAQAVVAAVCRARAGLARRSTGRPSAALANVWRASVPPGGWGAGRRCTGLG
jgi:FAD/FMN-containing dehydrogenase